MWAVPWVCTAIVALYVATRLSRAGVERAAVLRRLGTLAVAAWIGEDTVVRAYGFYAYSAHLGPSLDRVPVLVALIWSVVIDSAWQLAGMLLGERAGGARLPLAAGGIVLADAALIEPVAVKAGLWWWTQPGLFAVPPIGILGWALFTAAVVGVHGGSGRARAAPWAVPALLLLPAALTHVALIAAWWALFRWMSGPIGAWAGVLSAWLVLPALAVAAWRRALRRRVPRAAMLVRVPGALFFYVLLALFGRGEPALVAYAAAFAWPYLALVDPASVGAAAQDNGPARR